jgi:hypothetical protein
VPAGVSHLERRFVRPKVGGDNFAKKEVMVTLRYNFHYIHLEGHGKSFQKRIPTGG